MINQEKGGHLRNSDVLGHDWKTGHWTISVVVGISSQTLIVKENESLENFGGSRNFQPNVNSQKRMDHWKISATPPKE